MSKSFKDELKKLMEEKAIDPNSTGAVDMDQIMSNQAKEEMAQMSADEILKLKEQLKNVMGDVNARKMMVQKGHQAYAQQIPSGLKKAKEIISKIKGKKGLAAGVITTGALLGIPEESFAGRAISKISDAAEKADPSYYLDKAVNDEEGFNQLLKAAEDSKNAKKQEQDKIKQSISPVIKEVETESPIKEDDVPFMLGEKPSPDIEDDMSEMNMENYNKMLRKKLGYK